MGRIRTIKPEFPHSQGIGRLTREARLTFIQMWTIADDSGRARAASRALASALFPYDDDAPKLIEGWLAELENEGFITRYRLGRDDFLQVENWAKHQKIDKASPSKIPPPPQPSPPPREPSPKPREPSPLEQGTGNREQDVAAAAAQADASDAPDVGSDAELRAWLGPIVGSEPVALDVDMTPIRTLLDDPLMTRGDVETGIREAISRGRKKFRCWAEFDGWCRRAGKDRLGALPRASPIGGHAPSRGPRLSHFAALEIADPFEVQP